MPIPYDSVPSKGQTLSSALIQVQKNLGLTQKELAEIIHTTEATINCLKSGNELAPSSPEGMFATHFLRIYRSLDAILGGDDIQTKDWLTSYNDYFADQPINLLKSGNSQANNEVLAYLDAMRSMA